MISQPIAGSLAGPEICCKMLTFYAWLGMPINSTSCEDDAINKSILHMQKHFLRSFCTIRVCKQTVISLTVRVTLQQGSCQSLSFFPGFQGLENP